MQVPYEEAIANIMTDMSFVIASATSPTRAGLGLSEIWRQRHLLAQQEGRDMGDEELGLIGPHWKGIKEDASAVYLEGALLVRDVRV